MEIGQKVDLILSLPLYFALALVVGGLSMKLLTKLKQKRKSIPEVVDLPNTSSVPPVKRNTSPRTYRLTTLNPLDSTKLGTNLSTVYTANETTSNASVSPVIKKRQYVRKKQNDN